MNWNDAQADSYKEIMQDIEMLFDSPIDTLESAIPKLEELAQALDDYLSIRF